MKIIMKAVFGIALCGALTLGAHAAHPFLLVQESEYAAMRARTNANPWTTMMNRAIRDAAPGYITYDVNADYNTKRVAAAEFISANALCYILVPANSEFYKSNLVSQMDFMLTDLADRGPSPGYPEGVGLANVLFNAILALDVIYNDLSPTELATLEGKIDPLVNIFATDGGLGAPSLTGLWALYNGDLVTFENRRQDYMAEMAGYLGEDGILRTGPGYGINRFLGEAREVKALFMDVLEYQGYQEFYTNALLQNAHEFIFGYAVTPFGRFVPFGDTSAGSLLRGNQTAQVFRAYRFGEAAASYEEWNLGSLWPQGRLTTGLLLGQDSPPPGKLAPSKIFRDGGAFFIEKGQSKESLYGAMWNVKGTFDHSHKDVNALALSGYGQHLLMNSGYAGAGNDALGFSWNYIFNTAYSGNTVRADGVDHAAKHGAGVVEGFTADKLDYACAAAGPAVANGTHLRNLLFVAPVAEIGGNGYWTVFDEVTASSYCLTTFHPNSSNLTTVVANQEYESLIAETTTPLFEGDTNSSPVKLTTFLGTTPTSVTLLDGVIAAFDNQSLVGRYLEVRHNMTSGKKQTCTVLFPHVDGLHPKGTLTRLTGSGYSGVSVVQGAYEDLNIESGTAEYVLAKCRFQASHSWSRFNGTQLVGYFAKRATKFLNTALTEGFVSTQPVTIHMYGGSGKVLATNTATVTIYSASLPGGSTNLVVSVGETKIDFGNPSVIYDEKFDGTGVPLYKTTPNRGAERWLANTIVTDAGILTTNAGAAVLPFDPVTNEVYTLSIDFNYTSGTNGWLGLGFSSSRPYSLNATTAADRFSNANVPGYAWLLYRNDDTVSVFEGPTAGSTAIPSTGAFSNGVHNLKIVIDTTGDGSTFLADFFIDGTSITGGPTTIDAITVAGINYVGFSQSGAGGVGGTVDNFSLIKGGAPLVAAPWQDITETFTGPVGLALHGRTSTTGGAIWIANSIVTNNGSGTGLVTASAGSAVVAFDPETNQTYTLSIDYDYTGTNLGLDWFGLGFSTTSPSSPGVSSANDRLSNVNVPGIAWMYRRQNGNIDAFEGPRTAGSDPVVNYPTSYGPHSMAITLDTTGDGTSFTADFLIDGTSILAGGPTLISIPVADVNYAGITLSGNIGMAGSTVDNFALVRTTQSGGGPILSYTPSGNNWVFTWPGTGFKLQAQTNTLAIGLSNNWSDVPGGSTSGVSVPAPVAGNPAVFFRLISTP
jgi:hypothetical protein